MRCTTVRLINTFDNPSTWHGTVQLSDSAVDFKAAVDGEGMFILPMSGIVVRMPIVAGVYYRRLGAFGWSTVVNLYSSQYFRSLSAGMPMCAWLFQTVRKVNTMYMWFGMTAHKNAF